MSPIGPRIDTSVQTSCWVYYRVILSREGQSVSQTIIQTGSAPVRPRPVCRIASQPHLHKGRPDDGEEARQERAIHLSRVQRRRLTVYSVGTNMENLLALATRIAGRPTTQRRGLRSPATCAAITHINGFLVSLERRASRGG